MEYPHTLLKLFPFNQLNCSIVVYWMMKCVKHNIITIISFHLGKIYFLDISLDLDKNHEFKNKHYMYKSILWVGSFKVFYALKIYMTLCSRATCLSNLSCKHYYMIPYYSGCWLYIHLLIDTITVYLLSMWQVKGNMVTANVTFGNTKKAAFGVATETLCACTDRERTKKVARMCRKAMPMHFMGKNMTIRGDSRYCYLVDVEVLPAITARKWKKGNYN